jgi:hypothetical protein
MRNTRLAELFSAYFAARGISTQKVVDWLLEDGWAGPDEESDLRRLLEGDPESEGLNPERVAMSSLDAALLTDECENERLKARDAMLYGTSFEDPTGKRIDPATVLRSALSQSEDGSKEGRVVVELSVEEAVALVGNDGYFHEPPDECEHGFRPPDKCPNEQCDDRLLRAAWFKLRAALPESRP